MDAESVADLYAGRKKTMQRRLTQMEEVKRAYEGALDLPLPELARNEKPLVANLIAQGVDQTANRIVSTMPNVTCPALRAGYDKHEDNANERRNALHGFWSMNRLNLKMRKRARWLITFACAPVMVRPDPVRGIPVWQARNPMQALPPPGDELCPTDMIFSYQRSLAWLRRIYPESIAALDIGARPREVSPDTMFTVVEYCDYDTTMLVCLGVSPADDKSRTPLYVAAPTNTPRPGKPWVLLEQWINRAGICPATYPTRIGLDTPQGQFDGVLGLYWNQAMIMALEAIAVKKAIFPDRWKMARPNETVQTIVEADGMSGVVGELQGGIIQDIALQPGVQTMPLMDRIERAIRLSAGIPSELTGESASNIRTARRGAQILSSAIDFTVQECQEIFEASLEEENTIAIAIDKAYFSGTSRAYYFSWNGTRGRGEYDPGELWVTDENRVNYAMPGADLNELVVGMGQRKGMGTISDYRIMELDPLVEDPDLERDRVGAENLLRAFEQGLMGQIASGAVTPDDAAFIIQQRIEKRVSLPEAVMRAQKRAQARQASAPSAGPAETPAALPPGAPEAQPGLAAGPEGAGAAIAPPTESMNNLSDVMAALRRTSQPVG